MIKFLVYLFLFYFLFRFVFSALFKVVVKENTGSQSDFQPHDRQPPVSSPKQASEKKDKVVGEYVDFEEIK
jgi:hypothetical protein